MTAVPWRPGQCWTCALPSPAEHSLSFSWQALNGSDLPSAPPLLPGGPVSLDKCIVSWFELALQGKDMKASLQTASNDKSQFVQRDHYKAECNPVGSSMSSQGVERFANWKRMQQISLHLWHLSWLFFLSFLLCFFFFGTWKREHNGNSVNSRIEVRSHKQVCLQSWDGPADSVSDDSFTASSSAVFGGVELDASSTSSSSSLKYAAWSNGQKQLPGRVDNRQAWRFTWWNRTPAGSWWMQSLDLTDR